MPGLKKGSKRHTYDILTDTCKMCGVKKRTIPYVGNGFNSTFKNRMVTEYTRDGITWTKEFIDCGKPL